MFLASFDVLRPVARACFLVVEKTTYAKLFSSSSIPARPISRAGCFVAKYTVKPIAMFSTDRRIRLTFTIAIIRTPWIIATFGYTAMLSREDQTVRTVEKLRTSAHTLPVTIAVIYVTHNTSFRLARVLLLLFLGMESCKTTINI